MTFQSINFLSKNLKSSSRVFEYGGGGSTLFFLDYGANVTTVEHDPKWFGLLFAKIQEDMLDDKWNGILSKPIRCSRKKSDDPSDPDLYISEDEVLNGYCFKDYVATIDAYPNNFFDFVVIDGRSRPSCLKHASNKTKIGGHLILDNAERSYYLTNKSKKYLDDYRIIMNEYGPTPGALWFTKTAIFKRYK